MSLYGYAGGDPVNHSDPFGLCWYGPCPTADLVLGMWDRAVSKVSSIGARVRSVIPQYDDAEAKCSEGILSVTGNVGLDIATAGEGAGVAKAGGKAVWSGVKATGSAIVRDVGGLAARDAGAQAAARTAASAASRQSTIATAEAQRAAGALASRTVEGMQAPRDDNSGFTLKDLIPGYATGRAIRAASSACNP
jgi:hypothetical protein